MALIGLLVVGVIFVAGIVFLVSNISLSEQRANPNRYRYEQYTDENGETVEKVTEEKE
jgi:hypothetical protein